MPFTPDPTRPQYGAWQFGYLTGASEGGQAWMVQQVGASLSISGSTVLESASINTLIGTVSVMNDESGSSGWAYAITSQTPASKVNINASTGELRTNVPMDYETVPTINVTVTATKAGRPDVVSVFQVQVTNVLETTLAALALSNLTYAIGTPSSGAITGKTAGSNVTRTGSLPSGLTLDLSAMTWAWSGSGSAATGSFTLVETHADGINSPRPSVQNYSVTDVVPVVRLVVVAGDSNSVGRGDQTRGPTDIDVAGVWQYRNNSAMANYKTISSSICPLVHPDTYLTSNNPIGPGEELGRSLKTRYPADDIVIIPCGVGGTSIATAGEQWNPAAGGSSPIHYDRMVASITEVVALCATQFPGKTVVRELVYFDIGMNDVSGAVTGAAYYDALISIINTFRTTSQPTWSATRWVLAGLPFDGISANDGVGIERANIQVVASTANVYYVESIDDVPDDSDTIHRGIPAKRDMGNKSALIDTDTTVPTYPGLPTYYNTANRKLELYFAGKYGVVGTPVSSVIALDANFEVSSVFATSRKLRWTADGTKPIGTYDPTFTIIGGNRRTLDVPVVISVVALGTISPVTFFGAGERGMVWDLTDTATLFQDVAGATPVTAAGQVVGKVLDKSPNANHWAAAADNTTRPTYQVDADGKPYLQFDGSNDVLLASTPFVDGATNVSFTACIGCFGNTQATGAHSLLANNSSSSTVPFITPFQVPASTGNMTMSIRNDASGGGSVPTINGVLDNTNKKVISAQFQNPTAPFRRMRDEMSRSAGGAGDGWTANGSGLTLPSTVTRAGLGASPSPTISSFFNGRIYSGYAINRVLTDTETANGADWVNARTRTTALP